MSHSECKTEGLLTEQDKVRCYKVNDALLLFKFPPGVSNEQIVKYGRCGIENLTNVQYLIEIEDSKLPEYSAAQDLAPTEDQEQTEEVKRIKVETAIDIGVYKFVCQTNLRGARSHRLVEDICANIVYPISVDIGVRAIRDIGNDPWMKIAEESTELCGDETFFVRTVRRTVEAARYSSEMLKVTWTVKERSVAFTLDLRSERITAFTGALKQFCGSQLLIGNSGALNVLGRFVFQKFFRRRGGKEYRQCIHVIQRNRILDTEVHEIPLDLNEEEHLDENDEMDVIHMDPFGLDNDSGYDTV